jgi:hypothetical protein
MKRIFKGSSIRCPIACGNCCIAHEEGPVKKCVYLGENGCCLPRKERPYGCNEYLCAEAREIYYADV